MKMNSTMPLNRLIGASLFAAGLMAFGGAASVGAVPPNLIVNGGFEVPQVGTGYQLFSVGQTFPGWAVVGASGNVAPISGKFQQNGFTFNAASGRQWIDMTGISNSATGIEQTVQTAAGAKYKITFSVGNVINPGGIFGIRSTIRLYVDSKKVITTTNAKGSGFRQNWKTFSVTVRASSTSTTVEFVNGDPSSDTNDGLDAISMVRT